MWGGVRAAEPRVGRLGWGLQEAVLISPCPSLVPRYEVQLGDSLLSMSGCSLECWKDMVQKACCPGYWGSQCYGMGGPSPAPHAPARWHAPSSGSFNAQLGHLTLAAPGRAHVWGCPELLGLGEPGVLGTDLSSMCVCGSAECPGGAETPCSGHGTCLDGIDGTGTCVCQVRAR